MLEEAKKDGKILSNSFKNIATFCEMLKKIVDETNIS
jgi:hypothetical protein